MGTGLYLKKFSGTIAAVLIFAFLLGGIFLYKSEEIAETKNKVFPTLENEEVLSIMLKSSDSELNIDKEDGGWIVLGPDSKNKVDSKAVEDFIQDVKSLELIQSVSSTGQELSDFGLQEPPSEFMILSDRAEYYLLIGDQSPSGAGTYIYDVDKDRVMIADSQIASKLIEYANNDFKDKKVVAIIPDLVNRIVLRVGNFFIVLQKEDGRWSADPLSEGQQLDQAKADELVTVLSELEIKDVISRQPESIDEYGFDLPSAEIEIFQNGGTHTILFGKRRDEDEHYIKFESQEAVYSTSKENFKKLPKNLDDITQN